MGIEGCSMIIPWVVSGWNTLESIEYTVLEAR